MIESFNQSLTHLWKSQPSLLPQIFGPRSCPSLKMFQSVQPQRSETSHFLLCFTDGHPSFILHVSTDVCTNVMVLALKQPPSLLISTDPDTAIGCWLARGFYSVPDPVSFNTALWDDDCVHIFVRATHTSSISFIRQPARNPSRHPASYLHGEIFWVCPRRQSSPSGCGLVWLNGGSFSCTRRWGVFLFLRGLIICSCGCVSICEHLLGKHHWCR